MTKVTNSCGVSISFPWDNFRIVNLHIREAVYGEYPIGDMTLEHLQKQPDADKISKNKFAWIGIEDSSNGGYFFKTSIFITKRRVLNNSLQIDFICIPGDEDDYERGKDFYTSVQSTTYDNIISAITSTWPTGNNGRSQLKFLSDSNIPDSTKVFRDSEVGADFISRLCFSYGRNCVFAFSWDGLIIRNDLDVDKNNIDKDKYISGNTNGWMQVNQTSQKYSVENNYSTFNPWTNENFDDETSRDISTTGNGFGDKEPKYCTSSVNRTTYKIISKDYTELDKNYSRNTRFFRSKGYSVVKLVCPNQAPKNWKLTDIVMYKRIDENEASYPYRKYLVAGNEIFWSQDGAKEKGPHGYAFEWTITLWGIEKTDVVKEESSDDSQEEV